MQTANLPITPTMSELSVPLPSSGYEVFESNHLKAQAVDHSMGNEESSSDFPFFHNPESPDIFSFSVFMQDTQGDLYNPLESNPNYSLASPHDDSTYRNSWTDDPFGLSSTPSTLRELTIEDDVPQGSVVRKDDSFNSALFDFEPLDTLPDEPLSTATTLKHQFKPIRSSIQMATTCLKCGGNNVVEASRLERFPVGKVHAARRACLRNPRKPLETIVTG